MQTFNFPHDLEMQQMVAFFFNYIYTTPPPLISRGGRTFAI